LPGGLQGCFYTANAFSIPVHKTIVAIACGINQQMQYNKNEYGMHGVYLIGLA